MIIGYEGYLSGNQGIADRRRLLFWAEKKGHNVVSSQSEEADLVVVTSSSDLAYWAHRKMKVPLILDVVDGLIGEQSQVKDNLRGFGHWAMRRNSSLIPRKFSHSLLSVAAKSSIVICSSVEQVEEWAKFGIRAVDILDFHEEIPILKPILGITPNSGGNLFWEGLPATLSSIKMLDYVFTNSPSKNFNLNIATNLESFRYMNRFIRYDLKQMINNHLDLRNVHLQISQWNQENLVKLVNESNIGVIPISLNSGYNHLKAENRLLIMWRLGLPVLTSPLSSYVRVMKDAGIPGICRDKYEWAQKVSLLNESTTLQQEFLEKAQEYLSRRHRAEDVLEKWDSALSF